MTTAPTANTTTTPPAAGARFLTAIFAPEDVILLRPYETWREGGRRRSRVIYNRVMHHELGTKNGDGNYHFSRSRIDKIFSILRKVSEEERANVAFGVCRREGKRGEFDQAWQIRMVKALWADVDGATVAEVLERCRKAGLPDPSIVVGSGHGVHLYWLLNTPYHIDDVGRPLPVQTQWIENGSGKKMPHRFVVAADGTRYQLARAVRLLDECQLSAKAQHVQDVVAGLAAQVGGDATHDLTRLMRVPGTMNRKDQRNGKEPVPCDLVELDATRRYSFEQFEAFAADSPTVKRRADVAKIPLTPPVKMTAKRKNKLEELAWQCETAPIGERSERDFSLVCYSVEHGFTRDDVWSVVGSIGKFAEQGARYFDRTLDKAREHTRQKVFERLTKDSAKSKKTKTDQNDGEGASRARIVFDPAIHEVRGLMHTVTESLLAHGDVYDRAGSVVTMKKSDLAAIGDSSTLAGTLLDRAEFVVVDAKGVGRSEPFPPKYGNVWLKTPSVRQRLPSISMFTKCPVYTRDNRLVEPGYDEASGIYYAGDAIEPRRGTECIDTLLTDFCFRDPADRTNFLAMLLTVVLMPRFIGSKPAALLNGNQPGLGKTMLAQLISIAKDGAPCETVTYNKNDEELEKRLGALVEKGVNTIIIDNAKGRKIDSACLERCLTDYILSFRRLGKSESITAENSVMFCFTANAAAASPDLVTRSVPINLLYEGNPARRKFKIRDPEGYAIEHRAQIVGELLGMVEAWKTAGTPHSDAMTRFDKKGWSPVVGGILDVASEPDFLANAETAAAELDTTRGDFSELVQKMAADPRGWWTTTELAQTAETIGLFDLDFRERSDRAKATWIGITAGRFIGEQFKFDEQTVIFRRTTSGHNKRYCVEIEE